MNIKIMMIMHIHTSNNEINWYLWTSGLSFHSTEVWYRYFHVPLYSLTSDKQKTLCIPPPYGTTAPSGPGPVHYQGFEITLWHVALSRTPLDEWSAWWRDLYLTAHNRQTSMPLAGFKPAIPASEQPQTRALDRTATAICRHCVCLTFTEVQSCLKP